MQLPAASASHICLRNIDSPVSAKATLACVSMMHACRSSLDPCHIVQDRDALLSQRQPASAATATLTAAAAAAAQQLVAVPGNASAEHPDTGQQQTPKLIQSLLSTSYAIQHPGSGELRHGTEGWQCLETSFQV